MMLNLPGRGHDCPSNSCKLALSTGISGGRSIISLSTEYKIVIVNSAAKIVLKQIKKKTNHSFL